VSGHDDIHSILKYYCGMAKDNSQARDKTVTEGLPILIPTVGGPFEGEVHFQEGRATHTHPVRRFSVAESLNKRTAQYRELHEVLSALEWRRFAAIANLKNFATGTETDKELFPKSFQTLTKDAFGTLAKSLSERDSDDPKVRSRKWLPALFNEKVKSVRLVTWWYRGKFRLAIYCPDHMTALVASLLFSEVRACIGCSVTFIPNRPDQLYHDHLCANRWRKRRERERRKS
jgi:hypothetical protein